MNFFGHASIASWYQVTPGFVLGAMLPDFAGMLGARLYDLQDADVARGVALHHATDAAFHSLSSFVGLVRTARRDLGEAGLARGPARAVAHVGIELLLDETLSADRRSREAYLSALDHAERFDAASALRFREHESDAQRRWTRLIGVLRERGVPEHAPTADQLAARLVRVISSRPLLATDVAGERLISNWVVSARPAVVGYAEAIVTELRQRLDAAGFSHAASDRAAPHG